MKKSMLVDAVGMLDQEILADFYEMDAALDHVPVVKKKVKTKRVMIVAACIALAVAILLVSLPLALVLNRGSIEQAIKEKLFPENVHDSVLGNWTEWKSVENIIELLNLDNDQSVIDKLRGMQNGLFGKACSALADWLAYVFDYYQNHHQLL